MPQLAQAYQRFKQRLFAQGGNALFAKFRRHRERLEAKGLPKWKARYIAALAFPPPPGDDGEPVEHELEPLRPLFPKAFDAGVQLGGPLSAGKKASARSRSGNRRPAITAAKRLHRGGSAPRRAADNAAPSDEGPDSWAKPSRGDWRRLAEAVGFDCKPSTRAVIEWVFDHGSADPRKIDPTTVPGTGAVTLLQYVQESAANYRDFLQLWGKTIPQRAAIEAEARFADDGRKQLALLDEFLASRMAVRRDVEEE